MIWRALLAQSAVLVSLAFAVSPTINTSEVLHDLRHSVANVSHITRACVEVWPQCRSSVAHGVVSTVQGVAVSLVRGELQRAPEKRPVEVEWTPEAIKHYTQQTLMQRNLIQQRQ